MVDGTHHVFEAVKINGILPTNARIDLPEERSGHEAEIDAPQVGGSHKPRKIRHNASPHAQQKRRAVRIIILQPTVDTRCHPQALAVIPGIDLKNWELRQAIAQHGVYLTIRNDKDILLRDIILQIVKALAD